MSQSFVNERIERNAHNAGVRKTLTILKPLIERGDKLKVPEGHDALITSCNADPGLDFLGLVFSTAEAPSFSSLLRPKLNLKTNKKLEALEEALDLAIDTYGSSRREVVGVVFEAADHLFVYSEACVDVPMLETVLSRSGSGDDLSRYIFSLESWVEYLIR